ncbi:MAG: hypothetical protein IPN69_24060 [Acidobacteria bacterium]|nr:hypothetical protein [Acidobacteriota bacterium]MBK8149467.1 hypothetical protein [Acidobacteriota bacterium]MBK8813785.1 hypothetical protein [Acidobacteriota bacterium]
MNNEVNQDREHLKILSICHYVFAGLCIFPFLYGFIYTFMGVFVGAMIAADTRHNDGPPAALFGGIFVLVGLSISAVALAIGIAAIKSGRNMSKLNGRMFSFVFACFLCLFMPIGTILGVFSIIVLSRESVKRLFDGGGGFQQYGSVPPNWK